MSPMLESYLSFSVILVISLFCFTVEIIIVLILHYFQTIAFNTQIKRLMPSGNIQCSCLMEKAMAPHSSTLAWKIPWMEEPGRL